MLSDLLQGGFSRSQRAMATLIEREFSHSGFPVEMAAAAVVNAAAESSLVPSAVDPSGRCVGLFQLHEAGAGYGLTVAQRKDPTMNTRRILRVLRGPDGQAVLVALAFGLRDVAVLAGLFCRHVERSAHAGATVARREALARALFPAFFAWPVTSLPRVGSAWPAPSPRR